MIEINYKLNEVIVSSKKTTIKIENLGNDKIGIGNFLPKNGYQYALYIPNEERKNGIIQSVSYFIRKPPGGDASGPFRVRLYTLDSITKQPDKDILNVNLIVNGKKNWSWFTVDLRSYNLNFPLNGFFVAIEILPITDYKKGTLKKTGSYENSYNFPGLGFTNTKRDNSSWVYFPTPLYLTDRWTKMSGFNFSIKSKVIFYD